METAHNESQNRWPKGKKITILMQATADEAQRSLRLTEAINVHLAIYFQYTLGRYY